MGSMVSCSEGINNALRKVYGEKRDKMYIEMRTASLNTRNNAIIKLPIFFFFLWLNSPFSGA
jgi:hypothetical protein